MSLPLPNLDDRRWLDLVEEGRSLVPLYAPEWTDHNIHDPGIMLMELFAWIAEMDIYWLNRVPDAHKRKFLALAGVRPEPPRPARAVLQVELAQQVPWLSLPAATQFLGLDPFGQRVLFRLLRATTLVPGALLALYRWDGAQFHDLTNRRRRGETLAIWGEDPQPGSALYLGFDQSLPAGRPVSLFWTFAGERVTDRERERLLQEIAYRAGLCRPPGAARCDGQESFLAPEPGLVPHHSARLIWEFRTKQGMWQELDASAGQVVDETRALTLNGITLFTLPGEMGKTRLLSQGPELCFLRCRFVRGAYDAAPELQNVALNGLLVEQSAATQTATFPIAVGATITGAPPAPGQITSLTLHRNAQGEVDELIFAAAGDPQFHLLDFSPPGSGLGSLVIEAEWVDTGTGRPEQQVGLADTAVDQSAVYLSTLEEEGWRVWEKRDDFEASRRDDAHYLLDPTSGMVTFGDGERGRAVPAGAPVIAAYRGTLAEAGNLKAGTITELADTPHNRALLPDLEQTSAKIAAISNPLPASGGKPAETIDEATGRALAQMENTQRAVTLADIEALAQETPGAQLARVATWANLHPAFPCFNAPGVVTAIILPFLPVKRPLPSRELRQLVADYLSSRRVIGTRVEVVGPEYQEVLVRATVQACAGVDVASLQQRIVDALDGFFHPLTGGPAGTGWPFGRDVYRSEVLQVIDEASGVDHVLALELLGAGCEPSCANVCLGPLGLVAAGKHEIEVV